MDTRNNKTLIAITIVVLGALARFIPMLPNFSPIVALTLFGGAYLGRDKLTWIAPFAAIFISDLVLNNTLLRGFYPEHEGLVVWSPYMTYNYIAYAMIALVGVLFLQKKSGRNVVLASVGSSILFFLVTNAGAALSPTSVYSPGLTGIGESLIAGSPFLRNSMIGDLVFSTLFFGSFYLITRKDVALERA